MGKVPIRLYTAGPYLAFLDILAILLHSQPLNRIFYLVLYLSTRFKPAFTPIIMLYRARYPPFIEVLCFRRFIYSSSHLSSR